MSEVAATEFKAKCLRLIDEVQRTGIPLVVTKRGKPVVRILPATEPGAGLEGTILYQDENLFSTGETWEAES